jgi:hypothetical protein
MDRLQILPHQVRVSPRHVQRTVAKYRLQMEYGPTTAKVVDRKGYV